MKIKKACPVWDITTLGRGGSDITAVALGGKCELYKDEGGIFTADPKIVPEARLIAEIGYEEMMEMGSQGAKVVHPRATTLAMINRVEIFVTGLDNPTKGTLIHEMGGIGW